MQIRCPYCGFSLDGVPDILDGRELQCRECGERFIAPCFATQEDRRLELERQRAEERRIEAAREAERQRLEAEEQARIEQERQRILETDTGMGSCPQCGYRNITQFTTGGTDRTAQAATCCVGCLFFLPLILLAPFVGRHPAQLHARCNVCGHTWQI